MKHILILSLALCCLPGPGVAATTAQVELEMIAHEAKDGDPGAQLLYGLAYLEGRNGLQPDARKAVEWLRRSAQANNAYAQLLLGNCYEEGKGVEPDQTQATHWWRKAAEAGNVKAQFRLGKAYLTGTEVPRNDKKAIDWLTRAAAHGHVQAEYLIGKMYHEGYAVAQDQILAGARRSQGPYPGHQPAGGHRYLSEVYHPRAPGILLRFAGQG